MAVEPRIVCLDLDTFFVSVERLFDPSLVGKPVVVGGTGWRGVVTSASYEVRRFGVKSGMSIVEARRLAPGAVYVAGRHGVYGDYAKRVRAILERWTPVVQTASIDEFFLDFRGCEGLYRRPGDRDGDATIERVVRTMREQIQTELGLPASAGIAATRPLAKMASGVAKPAGVCMVPGGGELDFVRDLPVRKFPGIGPVAEARLVGEGITTLGMLLSRGGAAADPVRRAVFPEAHRALGADRPAFQEHDEGGTHGTISNESTFHADVGDTDVLRERLRSLTERVCWRLRRRGVRARTVTLKLRYADFDTIDRSNTIPATDAEKEVLAAVYELLDRARTRSLPIRLLGVRLSNLVGDPPQLALPFEAVPTPGPAIDAIRARFGYEAIRLGSPRRAASR